MRHSSWGYARAVTFRYPFYFLFVLLFAHLLSFFHHRSNSSQNHKRIGESILSFTSFSYCWMACWMIKLKSTHEMSVCNGWEAGWKDEKRETIVTRLTVDDSGSVAILDAFVAVLQASDKVFFFSFCVLILEKKFCRRNLAANIMQIVRLNIVIVVLVMRIKYICNLKDEIKLIRTLFFFSFFHDSLSHSLFLRTSTIWKYKKKYNEVYFSYR